jgi:flagellar biosynthesis/type III secretory pathway chaperone
MNAEMSRFIEVLESYEHLLHAETQAIASKNINLVEELLIKKDECMEDILNCKKQLKTDPREINTVDILIEKVIELQQRNFSTFSILVKDQKVKKVRKTKRGSIPKA